ncbi:hypothetical protein Q75_06810 [Bacillus coahuilensis p1.1.43]|uniref:Uncharacterized protein n=1 Tax=Bacillus coahuilensis p1.1.43 TaxID=1150625 RepID=A0A147K978_9BACI|nr:hypothetical protein Q75_06810 [Bacillus coahuilensis p1.1.43]
MFIEKIYHHNDAVVFEFEFVYITEGHPLNPYKVAKSTGKSKLVFNGVSLNKGIIHLEDGSNQQVFITDLGELEILTLNQSPIDDYYSFEILCTKSDTGHFCSIKIEAESFTLEWNEFCENAWFVGWNN